MKRAMVVRVGKGMSGALVETLIEAGVDVVACSGSRRKLTALEEACGRSPRLRAVQGDVREANVLRAAASEGVDVIFCCVYQTYDDRPEAVLPMLAAVDSVSAAIGAKVVVIEGVYRPAAGDARTQRPDSRTMRLLSPELFGAEVPNTIVYSAFKKAVQGKKVPLPGDPDDRREYAYAPDAARNVAELASQEARYGNVWRLGGRNASVRELLDIAGSVMQTRPRIEPVRDWKLKLLLRLEPEWKDVLDRYRQGNAGRSPLPEIAGGVGASTMESGVAATVAGIREKLAKRAGAS